MRTISQSVGHFAKLMEKVLIERMDDHNGWADLSIVELVDRLEDKVKDMRRAMNECDACEVRVLAIDTANYAMMTAENVQETIKRNYELANEGR